MEGEREALQRRVLRVLTAGQVVGASALAAAVTVGAFVVQDVLGHDTSWGGIATATVTLGTGLMAQVLSRRMGRRGRRSGLALGYGLAAAGSLVAAVGAERRSLAVFLAGLVLFGSGQASNLLARYAAMDLADPAGRSRAMSRVVFASTFGAVLGPLLIGPAQRAGEDGFGLYRYTGPWLLAAAAFTLAMANTALRLRPDPLLAARRLAGVAEGAAPPPPKLGAALAAIRSSPGARLALLAMVVSQASMVAVMTMTPVHMKLHGHEGTSHLVISVHIAGMYAASPWIGRFSDRRGRVPAIITGGALIAAAGVLAAVAGDVEQLLFPALWALGLGWGFGLIGGSSLLVESVGEDQRVGVQGGADLLMSLCGGAAGFSSGFLRSAVGYEALAELAVVLAGGLVVAAALSAGKLRRPIIAAKLPA